MKDIKAIIPKIAVPISKVGFVAIVCATIMKAKKPKNIWVMIGRERDKDIGFFWERDLSKTSRHGITENKAKENRNGIYNMSIKMTTLPSGLRVLTDTIEGVDSVALGAYFAVGTRHEDMSENGIAHLVEHMMFKGTTTRSARNIAETIEGIGGQMNAYTSREVTAYYFHILKDFVPLTIDVLADMLQRSVYDAGTRPGAWGHYSRNRDERRYPR